MVQHLELGSSHSDCGSFSMVDPLVTTLLLLNIAMQNGPFIDGLPFLKMGGFSMAMLNNQMVL